MNEREVVRDYVMEYLDPKSEDLPMSRADMKYHYAQNYELCDALAKRYEFAAGTRVRMTENLLDEKDRGRGWDYHAGHFLCTWNIGTVKGISHVRGDVIYLSVEWDYQTNRDGTLREKGKFPYSEERLVVATDNSLIVPDNIHPDKDRELKDISEKIDKKEVKLKELKEEIAELKHKQKKVR